MRFVIVIAAAGCWTGAESPPQEPVAPVVVKTTMYSGVAGTWRGTGLQYDTGEQWDIVMSLHAGAAIGESVGTIEYPTLECKAELFRQREDGRLLVMSEKMIAGIGNCVDGGIIRIPRAPRDVLEWRWFYPSGEEGARSQLRR